MSVDAPGVLTHPAGTSQVQSPYSGQAEDVLVRPTETVRAGQAIARLRDTGGHVRTVESPFTGQVISAGLTAGQIVHEGETVITVERTDLPDDRLVALVFVPTDRAARLRLGSTVDLSVSAAPPAAFGLLRGRVTAVSAYPLTEEGLAGLVGGELAASRFHDGAAPRLVTVDLVADPASASGYAWSTARTPPIRLASQTTVTASIQLRTQTPFDLVLGR